MHVTQRVYLVFFLSAVRFRFYQQYSDIQWGVENFYIGPACDGHCGGHGDCLDQRCLCDPGFTGPNCYASTALKVALIHVFFLPGNTELEKKKQVVI